MMRRKILIVITLLVIMLLTYVAPALQVFAADDTTGTTTMSFNTSLYKALKSYFQEVGIDASYNDVDRTITMETTTLESIEGLALKEASIDDLSGLENFVNIKELILSANKLSEESNLEVLNNLSQLEYLDLSSNEIKDISGIQSLIMSLLAKDSTAVNLSGQTTNIVIDVQLDINEEKTIYSTSLPQILEIAGIAENGEITNQGQLKSEWIIETSTPATGANAGPAVKRTTIPNPLTSDNNSFDIIVGVETESSYYALEGLLKMEISIADTSINSYNTNPATKNILKDSSFTFYFVVHTSEKEGIIFEDKNLYYAIKEQLTKDQLINKNLISYPYLLDEESETYYDICNYSISGTTATLTIDGETVYTIYQYGTGNDYIYDHSAYKYRYEDYEFVDVETVSSTGVITTTRKIKIAVLNTDCRDLYEEAYDEALALVITDLDLINKIESLILNDQAITDLSGLEYFVGLSSYLNVSYNYIDTLAEIYALQLNKNTINAELQAEFQEKLNLMSSTKTEINTAYSAIKSTNETINNQSKAILEEFINFSWDTATDEEITKLNETLEKFENSVYGYISEDGEEITGLKDEIEKNISSINENLPKLYSRLASMYSIYNKEYKLTSLLTPDLNYITEEEYEATLEKFETLASVKSLAQAQVSRIASLETAGALTEIEKALIVEAFDLILSADNEFPISAALNALTIDEEGEMTRSDWKSICTTFQEINIYALAVNYCTLERMNNNVSSTICFAEEFLVKQIQEFDYEGIDTTLLQNIYDALSGKTSSNTYDTDMFDIFEAYLEEDAYSSYEKCEGTYSTISILVKNVVMTNYDSYEWPSYYAIQENIDNVTLSGNGGVNDEDGLWFFDELMALANKFTTFNEISRYLTLPNLRKLDVSNNQIETLGDIEITLISSDGTKTTEVHNLTTLTDLKELYIAHNFVTGDIACVDWTQLTTMKKLDLSYNFIRDISPLQVLINLRYLNVSDNLLEGAFNLSVRSFTKLQDLILAGNKYDDISNILIDYEFAKTESETLSDYFAREDTVNIDLSRQELELTIEDTIIYDSSKTIYEIELPPIFAQLEVLDTERTAFGTTSSKGSIIVTGTTASFPIDQTGDYTGVVTVIADNGYPEDVTTSMGIGTSYTVNYSVKNINISSVKINETISNVVIGGSQKFTATVEGTDIPDTTVSWTVEGAESSNTTIDENGVLTVGNDETAETLTITATSNYDNSKSATLSVAVIVKTVTEVKVSGLESVTAGSVVTYTAEVIGENLEESDKTVTWAVYGNSTPYTMINKNTGVLTVSEKETNDTLVIAAYSDYDNSIVGTTEAKLVMIKNIVIESSADTAYFGDTVYFTATVEGSNLSDDEKAVTWSMSGAGDTNTVLSEAGVLTIGENETAEKITVTATSVTNTELSSSKEIEIKIAVPTLGYSIDDEDETLIVGVSPSTTSTTFKTKLLTDSDFIVVVNREGTEVTDSSYVATGDIVTIYYDDSLVETYELVVTGDVNGDGLADALDSSLLKAHRAKITTLTGIYLKAADINSDDDITVTDVRLLLYHRARIEGYIL